MTIEEIKNRKTEISTLKDREYERHDKKIRQLNRELEKLQDKCNHPKKYIVRIYDPYESAYVCTLCDKQL